MFSISRLSARRCPISLRRGKKWERTFKLWELGHWYILGHRGIFDIGVFEGLGYLLHQRFQVLSRLKNSDACINQLTLDRLQNDAFYDSDHEWLQLTITKGVCRRRHAGSEHGCAAKLQRAR